MIEWPARAACARVHELLILYENILSQRFAVECRARIGTTGQDREIKFPSGRFDEQVASSRIFISLFFSLSLSPPFFSFVGREKRGRDRKRVISRGWARPLGADSSLINGFKVSLIESNFLVLPAILIRRETGNGYLNFFSFSFLNFLRILNTN